MKTRTAWILSIAAAHTGVTFLHAVVHVLVDVIPGLVDGAFIVVVIIVGLPVGAVLAWRSHPAAPWVFGGTAGAAFVYGFLSHFLFAGPDHVASVGSAGWGSAFLGTSAVLGALEIAGLLAALTYLVPQARTPLGSVGPSP
ncbi:MAG TPA: hypothetical protein VJ326_05410 [Thermoplasmata archaeon]|nr:hypothetical protein [Thermoplasmata archaeon]